MGAAAFIMAEIVGTPYVNIMKAGLMPALLFFVSVLFVVHLQAVKSDLKIQESPVELEGSLASTVLTGLPFIVPFFTLIGMIFSRLFMLIVYVDPGAFAVSDVLMQELVREGFRGSGLLQYFSLITLTTIGYGDISPVSPLARNLAAVEGITGQLFVAAVIARLVALYTSNRSRPR